MLDQLPEDVLGVLLHYVLLTKTTDPEPQIDDQRTHVADGDDEDEQDTDRFLEAAKRNVAYFGTHVQPGLNGLLSLTLTCRKLAATLTTSDTLWAAVAGRGFSFALSLTTMLTPTMIFLHRSDLSMPSWSTTTTMAS